MSGRASVDERGVFVVLHLGKLRKKPLVEAEREDFRRRNRPAAFDRIGRRLPGSKAAVENRHRGVARGLQGPIDPRRSAEIGRADARRHHDYVAILVDADFADQLFQLGRSRHHERHAAARDAPPGLVVIAVHRARNMRLRVSLGAAAVDRRPDVKHHDRWIRLMILQPWRGHQWLDRHRQCRHPGHGDGSKHRNGKGPARKGCDNE